MDEIRNNPLLLEWLTPHQTPPFSQIKPEHYKPAIAAAIEEGRRNVQQIIDNIEAPTFANTIEALERSSETLGRITGLLFNINECDTSDELQQIVLDVVPDLSRFETDLALPSVSFLWA